MRALTPLVSLLLLGVLAAFVPGSGAQAEEEALRAVAWALDVRIVEVRSDPVAGLTPPFDVGGTTRDFDFAKVVATLRARGATRVLMDQRVTAVEGSEAKATNEHVIPIERFDTADQNSRRVRFDTTRTGCAAALLPSETGFGYEIKAHWTFWPSLDDAVPAATTTWEGEHRALQSGETLALHAREHVLDREAEPKVAEVYCFVTATASR